MVGEIGKWIGDLLRRCIASSAASPAPSIGLRITLKSGWEKFKMSPSGFKPSWIVIHHSHSADGQTRNYDSIKRYHMSYRYQGDIITEQQYAQYLADNKTQGLELPWSDIGYHFVLESVNGRIETIAGRPIGEVGAHAYGFNSKSIGICLVGNYDIERPSDDRLFSLASLCRQLQLEFGIPFDQVVGHRETYLLRKVPVEKTCPGSLFYLGEFRKRLIGGSNV